MCSWCGKENIGEPMVSGDSVRTICEHCGTSISDQSKWLSYKNLKTWAIKYAESKGYTKA